MIKKFIATILLVICVLDSYGLRTVNIQDNMIDEQFEQSVDVVDNNSDVVDSECDDTFRELRLISHHNKIRQMKLMDYLSTTIEEYDVKESIDKTVDELILPEHTMPEQANISLHVVPTAEIHYHYLNGPVRVDSTCTEYGFSYMYCDCGYVEYIGRYPMADHVYADWKTTREATKNVPGEQISSCSVCNHTKTRDLAYSDRVNYDINVRGAIGRLSMPDVGIDVALFFDRSRTQEFVDAEDSAALVYNRCNSLFADHNYQSFSSLSSMTVGMPCYLTKNDCTDEYVCIAAFHGHNATKMLTDLDNRDISEIYKNKFIAYTCEDHWTNVFIVVLEKEN